ncbi:MAG: AAA family ATPase [Steroidobacteraceae bacterium]
MNTMTLDTALGRSWKVHRRGRRCRRSAPRTSLSLQGDLGDLGPALLALRALQAFDREPRRYPVHRVLRCAVRQPLEELFDDLALNTGLAAHRLDETSLLLDGPGALVSVSGQRKTDYGSCSFAIWARDKGALAAVRDVLMDVVGDRRVRDATFTIDWYFSSAHLGLTSATFEELADPPLLDEAYPALGESVARLITRYLDARETVLILQGPPGTGKTRLVRAILAAMSRRKGASAKVLYTADSRALKNDEIFVEFITGSHDAFVVEDADHILGSRAHGNIDLHRFLAVADGVVRAQGRKILFTTNLPNVGDIDDALLRPGRCFANLRMRALERTEAARLLSRICGDDEALSARSLADALPPGTRAATLATLFRSVAAQSERKLPLLGS